MADHSSHAGHMAVNGDRKALVISGVLTGIYFVVELGIGIWTGSVAVTSDAFHTFSAVGGVLIALVALIALLLFYMLAMFVEYFVIKSACVKTGKGCILPGASGLAFLVSCVVCTVLSKCLRSRSRSRSRSRGRGRRLQLPAA